MPQPFCDCPWSCIDCVEGLGWGLRCTGCNEWVPPPLVLPVTMQMIRELGCMLDEKINRMEDRVPCMRCLGKGTIRNGGPLYHMEVECPICRGHGNLSKRTVEVKETSDSSGS